MTLNYNTTATQSFQFSVEDTIVGGKVNSFIKHSSSECRVFLIYNLTDNYAEGAIFLGFFVIIINYWYLMADLNKMIEYLYSLVFNDLLPKAYLVADL